MRLLFILAAVVLIASCTQNAPAGTTAAENKEQAKNNEVVALPLNLSSPAFSNNAVLPAKFTCEGADVNPELRIDGVPSGAKSLVLVVDDPDAPSRVWEHWTLINIPPDTVTIAENSVPKGAVQLANDFRRVEWGGPCPPPGKVHHYLFRLYALDSRLNLSSSSTKADVEKAMKGRVLEETVLVGTYER